MISFYFALVPLVLGLTAPIWFGVLLRPVWRLRKGAKWLDAQTVTPPASTKLTIQQLREHDKCGDKVVVAHHLAGWSEELQRKIMQHLLYGSAASLVLVVVFTVVSDPSLQGPSATLRDLLAKVGHNLPISLVLAAVLLEILVVMKLVSEQSAKFTKIIKDARPQQKSLSARIMERFGKKPLSQPPAQ